MNFLESVGLLAILVVVWFLLMIQNKIRLGPRLQGGLILFTFFAIYSVFSSAWRGVVSVLSPEPTQTLARPITTSPTRDLSQIGLRPTPTSQATQASCLHWVDITPAMNGREVCIYGVVTEYTENWENELSNFYFGQRDKFFLVSNFRWSEPFEGKCVSAVGKVQLNTYKTPYIKIEAIYNCDSG